MVVARRVAKLAWRCEPRSSPLAPPAKCRAGWYDARDRGVCDSSFSVRFATEEIVHCHDRDDIDDIDDVGTPSALSAYRTARARRRRASASGAGHQDR